MKFAREGYPFILTTSLLAALAWAVVPFSDTRVAIPALLLTVLTAFVCYFFRDPERPTPSGGGIVLSPGDGKIIDIQEIDEPSFFEGPSRRITIFLSVFNVHVQRSPITGLVEHREYRPGAYAVAWAPKASESNEQASLGVSTPWGPVLVKQIAGLIARRIVTYPERGDRVVIGDRIGLIRFGSRVDIFLPLHWPLSCQVGDKAVGGRTVFAHVKDLPDTVGSSEGEDAQVAKTQNVTTQEANA